MDNSNNIKDIAIREFAAAVASTAPSPGGGAVGAVTLALAAACALKTVSISLKNKRNEVLELASVKLNGIMVNSLILADSDASSFKALMDAFRLSRLTPEDTARRRTAIAAAASLCVDVGQKALLYGNDIEAALADAKADISPNMVNDVHAAMALVRANAQIQADNLKENSELLRKFSA